MGTLAPLLACVLSSASPGLPTLDASSDEAAERSIDRMAASMTTGERYTLLRDISVALRPVRRRCGLGYSLPSGLPYAKFLGPLDGKTAPEIRELAATARTREQARQEEMAQVRLELASLSGRIAAMEADLEALKPFVLSSRLTVGGSGGAIDVTVRNHTARPIAAARFRAVKCCGTRPGDWLSDSFAHRPSRPLAPGETARWTLHVPPRSPILSPGQVPKDFFGVTAEALEGPGGVRLHEFVYETAEVLSWQRDDGQARLSELERMRVGLAR